MSSTQLSVAPFAELELSVREAELTRHEAALGTRAAIVEHREREVELSGHSLTAQRERLDAVRSEYESRRGALTARASELDAERDRLRTMRAQLVALNMQLDARERAVASAATAAGSDQALPALPAPSSASTAVSSSRWATQLGTPFEAA